MKKYILNIIGAAFLYGSFTSCSDFLEIEPQNEITIDQFWNEKGDVEGMMLGCYTRMQGDDIIRRMMMWGEFRSDNISVGLNADKDINLTNVLKENLTASNAYTTWDGFYNIINRCNTIIKYAPEVAAKDPAYTDSELRATIAEASALRDLCYFYLIRTFRDVPVTFEAYTDDDQPAMLPATPFNEVLNMLIADLESVKGNAVKTYPSTEPLYQTGRITQTAINAMLCEMYLWQQDYQQCINYADLVIDDMKERAKQNATSSFGMSSNTTRTNGYPLIQEAYNNTTYGSAYEKLFVTGNSSEAIFELTFSGKENEDKAQLSNTAVSLFYGNSKVDAGYVGASTVVAGDNSKLFEKKYDVRYYEAMNGAAIAKFVARNVVVSASSDNPSAAYGVRWTENLTKSNWIIYRLTDIMLLKAEALAAQMTQGADTAEPQTHPDAFLVKQGTKEDKGDLTDAVMRDTISSSVYTVDRAIGEIADLEYNASTSKLYFIVGFVSDAGTTVSGGKGTFYLKSEDGKDSLLVKDVNGLGNKSANRITKNNAPAKGERVMIYGKLVKGLKIDQATLQQNQVYVDAAFDLTNAIYKRAVMQSTSNLTADLKKSNYESKSEMVKLIQEERQRELMFEGKRYYDLVRWAMREGSSETLAATVTKKLSGGAEAIRLRLSKMDGIFWPYFIDELKVNPNLRQNPAFGSGENSSYEKN